MILYIDTTDFNKVTFAVSPLDGNLQGPRRFPSRGGLESKKIYKIDPHKSYEILGSLENFLLYHKIKLEEGNLLPIKKIVVSKGPGSYTGVRIGVTIAMALGFAWGVPVKAVGKDLFKIR